jgi:hypothetical protein
LKNSSIQAFKHSNLVVCFLFSVILLTTSCSSDYSSKEEIKKESKVINNKTTSGELETFVCTSKISTGIKIIFTIVRNINSGFVTVHRDSAQIDTSDAPTVYFDESLSNCYTESAYALHLQIPNHPTDEYYFIPFENDNNGSGKYVIIKSTKDFECLCFIDTNRKQKHLNSLHNTNKINNNTKKRLIKY